MNPFSERYKSLSDIDLLRIIENQADYQPEAFEAAKNEITQRNLSPQEIINTRNELETERQKKENHEKKKAEVESKIKSLGFSFLESINPIQRSAPTTERQIKIISIIFGLIALFNLYSQFDLIQFILTDSSLKWDLSIVSLFLPLFLLPVSVILFWMKKKSGWILMVTYITFSAISTFGLIIMIWGTKQSGGFGIDSLFPQASLSVQIFTLLFYIGILWVLTQKTISQYFNIHQKTLIATITIAVVSSILFIAPFIV